MSEAVKLAVFPVAGFGTRFLPATKATPKEMLPVVDKPLIQYAVEEAYEAGIRNMIFVTGRNKWAITEHYDIAYELENELERRSKKEFLQLVRSIKPRDIARVLRTIEQQQQQGAGLGHQFLRHLARTRLLLHMLDCSPMSDSQDPVRDFEQVSAELEKYNAVFADKPRWLVLHNAHGPNFELGECPLGPLPDDLDDLRVLVPHRDTVRLNAVGAWARYLVLSYRQEGASKLAVMQLGEQGFTEFKELEFDEELYDVGFGTGHYWDAPCFRLSYDSFTTPARLYDYWPATGELRLLKEQEIPGGYNRDDYVAHRLWVTAQDGAQVPVSVIHRADLDMSVPNPTLLYGYGSYESTIDPSMSILWLSLLDRGIIVAVAHVRGGGEMGRLWYDNGKMLTKKNTFTDFIDVADYLIGSNMTTPELLVAQGGSAGGLLMGAVANMGGDRFKAIHAAVPFVDPLTSILMPELPLTVIEWEEWGNPLEDVAVYDYMASYSPYENVEAKPYPNILASTSLNDTRVLYVEPAKWVAKLRDMATSGDFLLKTEMSAGHGGVSGRYESWKQAAFEHAWIIDQLQKGAPA